MNAKSTKRRAAGSYITWPHSLTKWYAQQALPHACRLYLIVFYYVINLAQSLQHIWSLRHTPSELMTKGSHDSSYVGGHQQMLTICLMMYSQDYKCSTYVDGLVTVRLCLVTVLRLLAIIYISLTIFAIRKCPPHNIFKR